MKLKSMDEVIKIVPYSISTKRVNGTARRDYTVPEDLFDKGDLLFIDGNLEIVIAVNTAIEGASKVKNIIKLKAEKMKL